MTQHIPSMVMRPMTRHFESWWDFRRGVPPLYVMAGIWILGGVPGIGYGALAGGIAGGVLFLVCLVCRVIDNHAQGFTLPMLIPIVFGLLVAFRVGRVLLRDVIGTTRMYLRFRHMTDEEIETELSRMESLSESSEPGCQHINRQS